MLGFSLQKIMVLVGIIGAVWYGYKLVGRMKAARDAAEVAQGKGRRPAGGFAENLKRWSGRARGPAAPSGSSGGPAPEEMVACKVCGIYVSARGASPPAVGPTALIRRAMRITLVLLVLLAWSASPPPMRATTA